MKILKFYSFIKEKVEAIKTKKKKIPIKIQGWKIY